MLSRALICLTEKRIPSVMAKARNRHLSHNIATAPAASSSDALNDRELADTDELDTHGVPSTADRVFDAEDIHGVEGQQQNSPLPRTTGEDAKAPYRFLLDHIDAEIASLQRRHLAVSTRRQKVEERHSSRIKQLFELMESPWLLINTDVQPPLPATGVDVYLKEQQSKHRNEGATGSGRQLSSDAHDKMFVLAAHKNYRSWSAAQKKYYEQAAAYNAAVRNELKHRLATGCSRFEAFCEQVVECTADMARAGRVPAMPATSHTVGRRLYYHQQQRQAAQTYTPSSGKRRGGPPAREAAKDSEESASKEEEEEELPAPRAAVGKKAKPSPTRAAAKVKKLAKQRPPPSRKPSAAGQRAVQKGPSPSRVSASIPLPDLNKLAIRKLKKAVRTKPAPRASPKPKPQAARKPKRK